jgi:hypothetical protein
MMHVRIIVGALVLATAFSGAASARTRLACFDFHGQLGPDAGHPTYRIHPETADGLMAIPDTQRFPAKLSRLFPENETALEVSVTGDFTVCPLEAPQPGHLRLVQLKAARNLRRHKEHWVEDFARQPHL